jgi:acyl-CoA thioester hydrolase
VSSGSSGGGGEGGPPAENDGRPGDERPEPSGLAGQESSEVSGLSGQELESEEQQEAPHIEELFAFSYEHRVRYDEVDAQGIVGNASWLDILQLGRIEYLRYLGLMMEGGSTSPVQAVVRRSVVDYLAPARFDDPLLIRVRTSYLGIRSAVIEYVVDNLDTGLRPVVGETVLVCLDIAQFRSIAWPQVWRDRVAELEGEHLQIGQR